MTAVFWTAHANAPSWVAYGGLGVVAGLALISVMTRARSYRPGATPISRDGNRQTRNGGRVGLSASTQLDVRRARFTRA